jgi:hypothetical protein
MTLHWSHPIAVADLPPDGIEVELVPDADTRAALARHVGVLAVPELVARFKITPDGRGGAEVHGNLAATVQQTCVVTLEPFDNPVAERITVRFAPAAAISSAARSVEMSGEDLPDPLVGGVFDLAAVATEFLALAIDPYPRKPGAVFEPPAEGARGAGESAFAALGKLKRPPGGRP